MLPVKLTIKGLYSYQKKQEIYFDKLTSAHLFGIFGQVGSGKSALLEAITFALYGKTDRLNLSGDNRNYNMMNLKSDELLIDFEFSAGIDEILYRTMVRGRRNSKRFTDVKAFDRTSYVYKNDDWIPIECEAIEKVIGLSYENFKRTIIIPQGKFQEFLQLKDKDRTQMMKELFNLQRFELFDKVASVGRKNKEKLDQLEGKLQQIGQVDPEKMKEYEAKLKAVNNEIDKLKVRIEKVTKCVEEQKQLKQNFEKLNSLKQQQSLLEKKKDEIIQLEREVTEFEYCQLNFKALFEKKANCHKKRIEIGKEVEVDKTVFNKIALNLTGLNEEFEILKPKYERRDQLKQEIDEIQTIVKIAGLNINVKRLDERLNKGEKVIGELSKTVDLERNKYEEQHYALKLLKEKVADINELHVQKAWFAHKKQLDAALLEIEKEEKQNEKAIDDDVQKIGRMLDGEIKFDQFSNEKIYDSLRKKIESEKKSLKKEVYLLDQLNIQNKLKEFAGELNSGSACPLCGSTEHPNILQPGNVDEALKSTLNRKETIEKRIYTLDELYKAVILIDERIELKRERLLELKKKKDELIKQLDGHNKQKKDGLKEEAQVDKAIEDYKRQQQKIKDDEKQLDTILKNMEKGRENLEKYKNGVEEIRQERQQFKTEISVLQNHIKIIDYALFAAMTTDELVQITEHKKTELGYIEKRFNELQAEIEKNERKRIEISTRIKGNELLKTTEEKLFRNTVAEIDNKIGESTFSTINEVEAILKKELDTTKSKKIIEQFYQNAHTVSENLKNLEIELKGKVYIKEDYEKLKEEYSEVKERLELLQKEWGQLESEKVQLKKSIEQHKMLKKNYDDLKLRDENISVLKTLFKGSGFVNYISSVHLQNLCNAANDRFYKLTRQKLSLEITEDNNFRVRDFMNGGKTRNIKTLSGGQTFQAALSLALSLADNIQKLTGSEQNFFFLDEGFGSLDKESLQVVFDTLKTLRKENRIVGVISHVEEMQQEIDVHLQVENNEETGSVIKPSWQMKL